MLLVGVRRRVALFRELCREPGGRDRGLKLIRQQGSELFNSFSYWPEPELRSGSNIYDVRSYQLKPGKRLQSDIDPRPQGTPPSRPS